MFLSKKWLMIITILLIFSIGTLHSQDKSVEVYKEAFTKLSTMLDTAVSNPINSPQKNEKKNFFGSISNFEKKLLLVILGIFLVILIIIFVMFCHLLRLKKQLKVASPLPNQKNMGNKLSQPEEQISLGEGIYRLSHDLVNIQNMMERLDSLFKTEIKNVSNNKDRFLDDFHNEIENLVNTEIEEKLKTFRLNNDICKKKIIRDILSELSNIDEEGKNKSVVPSVVIDTNEVLEFQFKLNYENLCRLWKSKSFDSIRQYITTFPEKKNEIFDLCYQLKEKLEFDIDLQYSYKNAIVPLRDYDEKLTNLINLPGLIATIPEKNLPDSILKNRIQIIQKRIKLLQFLEDRKQVSFIMEFDIEKWIKSDFWDFVDTFYLKFQWEMFNKKIAPKMEGAKKGIDEILNEFSLEVIPIELGKTRFNGQLYIAKSYTEKKEMADSIISEVIRNGLRIMNGAILLQPEVVVNRII